MEPAAQSSVLSCTERFSAAIGGDGFCGARPSIAALIVTATVRQTPVSIPGLRSSAAKPKPWYHLSHY
jgi:hypothetical protein